MWGYQPRRPRGRVLRGLLVWVVGIAVLLTFLVFTRDSVFNNLMLAWIVFGGIGMAWVINALGLRDDVKGKPTE